MKEKIMVLAKAQAEKLMIAKSRNQKENGTLLCGTRYSNVMASCGSVITLFLDQVKSGKEITITGPIRPVL